MRISIFIIALASLQSFALVNYAQTKKIDLKISQANIVSVLEKIEDETEFFFFYNNQVVKLDKKVSIDLKDKSINEVLDAVFKDTDIEYSINNRQIILSTKELGNSKAQQPRSFSGKVSDSSGASLIGVSVVVKGSTNGTITDANGSYSLSNIPENATLQFSFMGMKTQEIPVAGKTTVNVVMVEDAIGIEEVVAIGYGTQKKVNLTGSIDVVNGNELADRQAPTVSQLLQGLSPSLSFDIDNENGFQPGATMDITIRGIGSLNGGSPYVVIDGFPGNINNLNPNDIESISVLKDAAASAIYGARAPYGVILITTKSGKKDQKMSVTYTGSIVLSTPSPLPQTLDSYTYARVNNEAGDNAGGHVFTDATIDRIIAYQNKDWDYLRQSMPDFPADASIFGAYPQGNVWNNANLNYANNNWWDIYYGNSVNQAHDLSVQGGAKNVSYFFSAGYLDKDGVLNFGTDKYSRSNILGKFDLDIAKWWTLSWETRFSKENRIMPNMTNEADYSYVFRQFARAYPTTPLYDGYGHYTSESHIPSMQDGGNDYTDTKDFWNNFKMEIRPLKGWKINADYAYNVNSFVRTDVEKIAYIFNVDQTLSPFGTTVPNNLEKWHSNNTYWTSNIYSSYDLNLTDHHFGIMAGMQFEKGNYKTLHGYKSDMILQSVPSFQTAFGTAVLSESLSHRATMGFFSRFNYNYKEKYLVEANGRYDGSYVFRKGNRWGLFPSFSLGWNVHKEPFWANLEKYINTLKFRGSWGQLGNQNISPYSDLELIPTNSNKLGWLFNYGSTQPIGYTTAPGIVNRNLTWETATTKNIGINMTFLNNRLTTDLDLFERLTTDMVGPSIAKPGVLGAGIPAANNSTLRTRGWELTLNWKDRLESGFSYHIGVNLSDYKSVVTKYFNPTGTLSTWREGQEVGELWGYTVYDLYRTQEEVDSYLATTNLSKIATTWRPGDVKYEDTNGDFKVNNGTNTIEDHGDMSIIGNTEPHYQYGITAGMNFKGFDFSMLWRGVAKKDIYFKAGGNIFWGFSTGRWYDSPLQPRILDYFRDTPGTKYSGLYEGDANINTDAYWPRPYLNQAQQLKNTDFANTRYLQDGSYLRLQNIQLGYSLPQRIVSKLKVQKLRVSLSGENLITFTKLPNGIDPAALKGYNVYGASEGRMTYGADRIFSFTMSITY